MVSIPAETPPTRPVYEPMVATAVLLLLHVPPDVALLNTVLSPAQIVPKPMMGVRANIFPVERRNRINSRQSFLIRYN